MKTPTIFIGSASESLHVVEALVEAFSDGIITRCWNAGAFKASGITIQSLISQKDHVDFACFILDKQDILISRETKHDAPRDNVVFEIGLFIGMLGLKRTLILFPSGEMPKIPNDLDGLTLLPVPAEVWDKNCSNVTDLISKTATKIERRAKDYGTHRVELDVLINQLDDLRVSPKEAETEQIVIDRFPPSVLEYVRIASSAYNKYPINLLRDVCLYIDSPFEIQDVHELSHVQGNLEGEKEVWVFAIKILDLVEPIYTTAKNNIERGLRYVYFQHDEKNYKRLVSKLEEDIGKQSEWRGATICIVVPKEILMPCDYLIYDPNLEKQKGYVGKSTNSKDHLLIELNDKNVEYTINTWEDFVVDCWDKYNDDKIDVFNFTAE